MHARVRFWSNGTLVLAAVMAIGYGFGLARLLVGMGPVTNLTDQYPWGIWIAIDVATGVALAAGGFTTAALVNVFGRRRYHALERPALLTAWLGYTFVSIGLLFDLGRYFNIWRPLFNWQGNSVLFEVGMCVMVYLFVLTVEMLPALLGGLKEQAAGQGGWARLLKRFEVPLLLTRRVVRRVLPGFIVLGVVLSSMHQSSLGGLMLIAPTKLSPLWWTPILPALFLLSAITVGLPVVIFEGFLAAKSFRREPEMELLAPLGRIVPWFLGAYLIVKLVDVFVRNDLSVFLLDGEDTVSWLVEVGVGLLLPLLLLSRERVRNSPRGLFISACLVISGVVLNRINVFLVGFHPPFAEHAYFPAIGEIAITAALISTILFLYRFVATFFPVLPADGSDESPPEDDDGTPDDRAFGWARGIRRPSFLLFVGFIVFYVLVHRQAITESERYTAPKGLARDTTSGPKPAVRTTPDAPASFSPEAMPALLVLSSPLANAGTDDYEPVRFMHRAHATHTDGDCTVCHHRVQDPEKPDDRVGREISQVDMTAFRPSTCGACHRLPDEPDAPTRPGLKGAYHQQCVSCHERVGETTAPVGCRDCHRRFVPDHTALLELPDKVVEPRAITARCLECHPAVGDDVLGTSHWLWRGASPHAKGREHETSLGKLVTINNYCIGVGSNMEGCTQCHIGYGAFTSEADFEDPSRIDCLVCHDTTGTYRKAEGASGAPEPGLDLAAIAGRVGQPTRAACGSCHFHSEGGPNVKHGDLEPGLANPSPELDVHMGEHGLACQDCHTTTDHEVAGKASTLAVGTNRLRCEQCHGDAPHAFSGSVRYHLDQHLAGVACQACHIPAFARESPTAMLWDWSKAGQDLPVEKDALGMPTFDKKKGAFTWARDVVPEYRWDNGRTRHYSVGEPIDPAKPTTLAEPQGSYADARARIAPFKHYRAKQPYDAGTNLLAVPNLWDGFWLDFDWAKALRVGMASVGQTFSGTFGFAETETWHALHHTVVPKERSLRCRDCHEADAVSCTRCHGHDENGPEASCEQCHGSSPGQDFQVQLGPAHPATAGKRLHFEELGYAHDPALLGGRFRKLEGPFGARKNDKAPALPAALPPAP
jgi:octaheme c-type cytochrome (tetrathionate reductase family)